MLLLCAVFLGQWRCGSLTEKAALVRHEPSMSVQLIARQEGVSAGRPFQGRKLGRQDALTAVSVGEAVVLASEFAAVSAQIAKLQQHRGERHPQGGTRSAQQKNVDYALACARPAWTQ